MTASVVCNAGPLIALAIADQLRVLPALYQRVLVPEAVIREVVLSGTGRTGAREVEVASWIEVVPAGSVEPLLAAELGAGESQVIDLAVRLKARLDLLDERRARRVASQVYNLRVRGTAGLLVEAKRAGLVPRVRPLLEAMVGKGYFLSARLVEICCQEAGE
ncbi:MAG TPA: DUF3368 domain-containing protein [Thermoanaerobaculia bacterium]